MSRLKVLTTGVAGRIGPHILPDLLDNYELIVLDRKEVPGVEHSIVSDLQDRELLKRAMEGVDVVVHLAATSDEAPFVENLVPNNVIGTYNVFEAAREAGVKRIVFASTIQTVNGRKQTVPIHPSEPPSPVTTYGVTKVFGEILGRYYYDQHGLEFVALRIGAFQAYDSEWLQRTRWHDIWLSPRDMVQILRLAIEKPGIGYAVVNATSKPETEYLSLDEARAVLGYEPADRAADYA
jgi:uronate dehydrogenase